MPDIPILCLAGPTGAGKTDLAIALARHLDGEIINGDSRQLYADFPIVTAQPDTAQRRLVPHHLYGILPSTAKMSAGEWTRAAFRHCQKISARGHLPIIVGGTGFYFEALLHGLAAMPPVPAEITRSIALRLLQEGSEALYRELQAVDPKYAGKIHSHDRQRIQRALEVYAVSGKSFSWWHDRGREKVPVHGPLLVLATPLAQLEPRLALRLDAMLEAGALEEVKRGWQNCPDATAPGFSGIGCREILACLKGQVDLSQCRQLWLAATRAYAKRQITWFRGRKNALWLNEPSMPEVLKLVEQFKKEFPKSAERSENIAN